MNDLRGPSPQTDHVSRAHVTRRWVGAAVLAFGLAQFLVVHLVVENAWDTSYSWAHNNISDLGNVSCGVWGPPDRYVCSPRHDLMNVAFVVLGAALVVGVGLVRRRVGFSRTASVLLAAGGVGFALAGVFPADVDENMHVFGAVLIFFLGNAGLVVLGISRRFAATVPMRVATAVVGTVGLVAVVLFLSGSYAGLGMGGMERVTAYALPVWLIVVAARVPAANGARRPARRR